MVRVLNFQLCGWVNPKQRFVMSPKRLERRTLRDVLRRIGLHRKDRSSAGGETVDTGYHVLNQLLVEMDV